MKHAALIFARPDPGLLADLTAELWRLRLFPDQFHSEVRNAAEVEIRLVIDCDDTVAKSVRHFCEAELRARSVMIAAIAPPPTSPLRP